MSRALKRNLIGILISNVGDDLTTCRYNLHHH